MMKQTAMMIVALMCGLGSAEAQQMDARLNRTDGRAWRVVLEGCSTNGVAYRLENGRESKMIALPDVRDLEIKLPELDLKKLNAQLASADYAGVISVLEPAVGTTGPYMMVSNNAVSAFALLAKAFLRNGDAASALQAAEYLQAVADPALKTDAHSIAAQALLESGRLDEAKTEIAQLEDPAAKLYLTARVQRAEKQSKESMQTVIELIASHPNNHEWMPQTELLCAQLYLDLEMPESAAEVARQVVTLYPASEFKVEAQKLQEQINSLIEQSEQAE